MKKHGRSTLSHAGWRKSPRRLWLKEQPGRAFISGVGGASVAEKKVRGSSSDS